METITPEGSERGESSRKTFTTGNGGTEKLSEIDTFKTSTVVSTTEKQQVLKQIQETKSYIKSNKHYLIMVVIANAFGTFIYFGNLNYLKNTLKVTASEFTQFDFYYSIPPVFKLLYAWISDSFYPFGYRIKGYVTLMASTHVLMYLYIIFMRPGPVGYTVCLVVVHTVDRFITSMAEGVTVMTTKLEAKLEKLQKRLLELNNDITSENFIDNANKQVKKVTEGGQITTEEKDQKNMRNFGTFIIFMRFLYSSMMIVAGWIADHYSIEVIFILANFGSLTLLVYITFFFSEKKMKRVTVEGTQLCTIISKFAKLILSPIMILPIILYGMMLCTPYVFDAGVYILTKKAGWSNTMLGFVDNLYSLFNTILIYTLLHKRKGMKFETMFTIGVLFLAFSQVLLVFAMFPGVFPSWLIIIAMVVVSSFYNAAGNLTEIPIVGKISRKLPEGFESTGTNLITGMTKFFLSFSKMFAAKELKTYHVYSGYYERIKSPVLINVGYGLFLSLIAPFMIFGSRLFRRGAGKGKGSKRE